MPSGTPTLVDPMSSGPGPIPPAAPPGSRGRGRQVLIWTLLSAAVLLASLAVGEWGARTQEMNRLADRIEESEAAMTQTMAAVTLILGPSGSLGEMDTADATEQLQEAANKGLAGVRSAASQIETIPIQPWHHEVLAARDVYLAHNEAWQDFLTRAADDPSVWLTNDSEIESTWNALDPVLRAAVPNPAILNLDQRVDEILDDGAPADDSGGGHTIDA